MFRAAVAALESWEQFNLGWMRVWPAGAALREGTAVAVVAWLAGLWWLNACRVVYRVEDQAPSRRFGFAYGTLPDHAESGEERFLVEQDPDGGVWYDILAFSRPRHPLARLGYPWTRRVQKRFTRESVTAMTRAARPGGGG